MPYKTIGKKVYVNKGGSWRLKATAKSPANAKKMVRLLRGVEHGFVPNKR